MPKNWALDVALATSGRLPDSDHRIERLRRFASKMVVKPSLSAALLLGILLAGKSSPALAIRAVYDCEPVVANCTIDGCEVKGSQCTLIGWEYENSDFALLNDRSRPTTGDNRDETGPTGAPGRAVDKKVGEKKEAEQKPCDEPTTGQPVVIATGNKIKPEIDFILPPDQNPLALVRFYDKSLDRIGIFGKSWASSIEYSLSFEYGTTFCAGRLDAVVACSPTAPLSKIYAVRTSGFALIFQNQNGVWTDGKNTISSVGGQWVLTLQDGGIETYDGYGRPLSIRDARGIGLSYAYSSGKLSTVTHTSGRSIQIGWSGTKVGTVTAPNSKTYTYTYSGNNLAGVAYPDNLGTRTYHYEDSTQPSGLTGISINGVRYSRYAYQADGRVAWSGLEGGTERSTFAYGADYTDVTNATGQTTRYQVADFNGTKRTIGVERPASSTCASGARYTAYDANGNIDYELDAFGIKKDYTYDADGHPTQIVAGLGPYGETDQQQITQYVWDAVHKGRLNQVKVFGNSTAGQPYSTTTYTYYPDGDARARLLQSVAVTNNGGGAVGTLTTTYNYTLHPSGMIATMTVDGPLAGTADSVVSTFDTAGNLLTVKNSLDHTTTYGGYNALGQPGTITSPNGAVTTYTYNARGQVLTENRIVNGVAQTTATAYDTRGRPVSITTPDGVITRYGYDQFDRLTSTYRTEPYSYVSSSLSAGTSAFSASTTGMMVQPMAYAPPPDCDLDPDCDPYPEPPPPPPPTPVVKGNIDGLTSDNGAVRGWACATTLNTSIAVHLYVGGPYGTGTFVEGGTANLASEPAVATACSASGANYRFSLPLSESVRQQYGGRTIYIHGISPTGGANNLLSASGTYRVPALPPPPVAFEHYTYNLLSQVTQIVSGVEYTDDAASSTSTQQSFGAQSLSADSMSVGTMAIRPCDPDPDCYPEPDPDPEPSRVTVIQKAVYIDYDAGGFVSQRRGNHGQSITYHYNANGDVDWMQDALGNRTTYGYDRHRRVSSITDPKNGVTTMTYNALGQVATVRDARGNTTSYAHDGLGNLLAQTSPDTGATAFTYNAVGQRTGMTKADGSTLSYGYDGLGRLISIASGAYARAYAYDWCANGKGMLCSLSDNPNGLWTHFAYTPEGRLWIRRDSDNGGTHDYWTGYNYNGAGQLSWIDYPSGVSVVYGYVDGNVATIDVTVNGTTSRVATIGGYQFLGPATRMTYGNGLVRTVNYDTDRRITGISTSYGTPIQSLTYGFDAADRITAITNGVDANLSQTFGYDALSRVTSAANPGGNAATFGYDTAGNRIGRTDSAPASSTTYTYAGTSSRLLQSVQGALTRTYTTNAVGDITAFTGADGVANTLAYDPFGRLASHTRSGVTTNYGVNALDQRMTKAGPAVADTTYVYAGQNQLLAESNANGWTSYVWYGNEPVALVRGNQIYYIHDDHLGRPEKVTNSARAIVWRANNFGFNRSVALDAIGGLNLGFPGQYWDAESGLWHNGYRDYDSTLGRYLQSDPIGLKGGGNTYVYAFNNPVTVVDPLGLDGVGSWTYPAGPQRDAYNAIAGGRKAPDYVRLSANYWVFNGSVTMARNGRVYGSYGVSRNYPHNLSASISLTAGTLNQCDTPTSQKMERFLTGPGVSTVGAFDGVGAALTYSPGEGTATEVGIGVGAALDGGSAGGSLGIDQGFALPFEFGGW